MLRCAARVGGYRVELLWSKALDGLDVDQGAGPGELHNEFHTPEATVEDHLHINLLLPPAPNG
jgi:hypothetical protein